MQHFTPRPRALPSFTHKQTRLLTKHEAAQPCAAPACGKPAKGEHQRKVYCGAHFLAVIQQEWL